MDASQLQNLVRTLTETIAKEEHELQQLTVKVNELKRKLPDNKNKLEKAKRDLLATEALQRRKQMMINAAQQKKELGE